MSTYTQYADHNFYLSNFATGGTTDINGYHEHEVLGRDTLCPKDHPHYKEIMELVEEQYRAEDMPSNGSTNGTIQGKVVHNADTRDLYDQACAKENSPWELMMLRYQQFIRKTARWINGYNPDTKAELNFRKKITTTKAKMKVDPKYRKKLSKRWELLKMLNPALTR